MFLKISQNSQESLWPATSLKNRLWHRCFPVNSVKFLRSPFLQSTHGRLLLLIWGKYQRSVPELNYCDDRIRFLLESVMETGSFKDRWKDTFSVFIATVAKNKNVLSKCGTVIQTWITCQKIPCYMLDLAFKWRMFKHLWIIPGVQICRILINQCKWVFMNLLVIFLDQINKMKLVPGFFLAFLSLYEQKFR